MPNALHTDACSLAQWRLLSPRPKASVFSDAIFDKLLSGPPCCPSCPVRIGCPQELAAVGGRGLIRHLRGATAITYRAASNDSRRTFVGAIGSGPDIAAIKGIHHSSSSSSDVAGVKARGDVSSESGVNAQQSSTFQSTAQFRAARKAEVVGADKVAIRRTMGVYQQIEDRVKVLSSDDCDNVPDPHLSRCCCGAGCRCISDVEPKSAGDSSKMASVILRDEGVSFQEVHDEDQAAAAPEGVIECTEEAQPTHTR